MKSLQHDINFEHLYLMSQRLLYCIVYVPKCSTVVMFRTSHTINFVFNILGLIPIHHCSSIRTTEAVVS